MSGWKRQEFQFPKGMERETGDNKENVAMLWRDSHQLHGIPSGVAIGNFPRWEIEMELRADVGC